MVEGVDVEPLKLLAGLTAYPAAAAAAATIAAATAAAAAGASHCVSHLVFEVIILTANAVYLPTARY